MPDITNPQAMGNPLSAAEDAQQEFFRQQEEAIKNLEARNQPNLFQVAGALARPTKTGNWMEALGAGTEEYGRQMVEREKLEPSLMQMRAQLAKNKIDVAKQTINKENLNDFLKPITTMDEEGKKKTTYSINPDAIPKILKYSDDPLGDMTKLGSTFQSLKKSGLLFSNAVEENPFKFLGSVAKNPIVVGEANRLAKKFASGQLDEEKVESLIKDLRTEEEKSLSAKEALDFRKLIANMGQNTVALGNQIKLMKIESQLQAPIDSAKSLIRIVNETRNHPGRVNGLETYDPRTMIPGTKQYDFITTLESAKSGAFINAVKNMVGLGHLSNAEGSRLESLYGSLKPTQSKEQFDKTLNEIDKIMKDKIKFSTNMMKKFGLEPTNYGNDDDVIDLEALPTKDKGKK
jgi:hypothetical protein